jgi:DNA-binding NtrC family response regulator
MAAANSYRLIISDMSRPPDQRAGYTLLDALPKSGVRTPVVFYTGSQTAAQAAEARAHGAVGSTASARELIAIVTSILNRP